MAWDYKPSPVLESAVGMSRAAGDLDFFRVLRRYDSTKPEIRDAIGFARTWADFAQRVLCAQAAQAGDVPELPSALAYPALLAYIEAGPADLARAFLRHIPAGWSSSLAGELAYSAQWLAGGYDAQQPLRTSLQVWVGETGQRRIMLYGPPGLDVPPDPLQLLQAPPLDAWIAQHPAKPAALIAHYDLHGLAMLALSLRELRRFSLPAVDAALSFEWTGDISKLWKRAVAKTVTHPSGYATVALIDCSVHSRQPEYTLKAIAKLDSTPHCRLFIVDHHVDTALLAPQLLHPQVQVVLTDVLSCGLSSAWEQAEEQLRVLGALGDKVPEVAAGYPAAQHPALYGAMAEYNRRLIEYSPTPPEMKAAGIYPLRPLWEALADGREVAPQLAVDTLGELQPLPARALPEFVRAGSLLLVTQKLNRVGRTWYALLEELMAREGEHYAAAVRIMDDTRANMLLLTDWRAVHLPPVRHFVPEVYLPRCLGHPSAVWADLDKADALPFLSAVAERMNHFLGTPGEFTRAAEELKRNVLDAPAPAPE